ncbi:hypothetical protein FQR65_LT14076 [Abscondita terminalis]|nr:hypothetical protein FQR65_LT14076 [Abscondita terminalis]
MNPRPHIQPYLNNSLAIRQEIQRFESVHPSIYAIYDLIDLLPDGLVGIAQQIRDHVVCIEGDLRKFALLPTGKSGNTYLSISRTNAYLCPPKFNNQTH